MSSQPVFGRDAGRAFYLDDKALCGKPSHKLTVPEPFCKLGATSTAPKLLYTSPPL